MVASQTRRRWALVALGLAALLAVPTVLPSVRASVAGATGPAEGEDAEQVLRRALGSEAVAHSATAETRGTLGLPDLPSLGGVAGLLGGTTRTRVWWSSPQAWRVDTTTTTGEQGDYGVGDAVVTWDYERSDPDVRGPRGGRWGGRRGERREAAARRRPAAPAGGPPGARGAGTGRPAGAARTTARGRSRHHRGARRPR